MAIHDFYEAKQSYLHIREDLNFVFKEYDNVYTEMKHIFQKGFFPNYTQSRFYKTIHKNCRSELVSMAHKPMKTKNECCHQMTP
jgi:hypothetical protein